MHQQAQIPRENAHGSTNRDDPRTSGDPRHSAWTNLQQKWLEMTCVIVDEYQCHVCQAVSIQLHLMPVTSLAVKRLQWVAGRGGGGR